MTTPPIICQCWLLFSRSVLAGSLLHARWQRKKDTVTFTTSNRNHSDGGRPVPSYLVVPARGNECGKNHRSYSWQSLEAKKNSRPGEGSIRGRGSSLILKVQVSSQTDPRRSSFLFA
jgi:hypothetical protein